MSVVTLTLGCVIELDMLTNIFKTKLFGGSSASMQMQLQSPPLIQNCLSALFFSLFPHQIVNVSDNLKYAHTNF